MGLVNISAFGSKTELERVFIAYQPLNVHALFAAYLSSFCCFKRIRQQCKSVKIIQTSKIKVKSLPICDKVAFGMKKIR